MEAPTPAPHPVHSPTLPTFLIRLSSLVTSLTTLLYSLTFFTHPVCLPPGPSPSLHLRFPAPPLQEYHVDGFRFDLASILTRAHSAWHPPVPPASETAETAADGVTGTAPGAGYPSGAAAGVQGSAGAWPGAYGGGVGPGGMEGQAAIGPDGMPIEAPAPPPQGPIVDASGYMTDGGLTAGATHMMDALQNA